MVAIAVVARKRRRAAPVKDTEDIGLRLRATRLRRGMSASTITMTKKGKANLTADQRAERPVRRYLLDRPDL